METETPDAPTAPRLTSLADRLDCFTEHDLLLLAGITPTTAEGWRKRGVGPAYVRAGNRYLYPRNEVAKWLEGRVRERVSVDKGAL
jgi:hypothetical protein